LKCPYQGYVSVWTPSLSLSLSPFLRARSWLHHRTSKRNASSSERSVAFRGASGYGWIQWYFPALLIYLSVLNSLQAKLRLAFSKAELDDLLQLMSEKEIRIRTDIREIELYREMRKEVK
jgi:hypothetical protein